MNKRLLTCTLLLAVVTAGCAHREPAYLLTPRAKVPYLPADLSQKQDMSSCLKLLAAFSTPQQTSDKVCSTETP